ncbi:hypothetical protein [Roseburia sp. 499]|uniref:hypothetical protein n=1 Tax=Roseburia sp. 499 TaxID=1261634 RepID=UPI0009521E06|nr:hypothetical protein [Roseburia sp. 499]WVK70687.1 hypothetical protein BIV20_03900 [Roseburia sp. 499]
MGYFFKKEAIIVALYIVLIVILRHGTEKKKITYWKIVESFIIVVGLEAMTEYYGAYMASGTQVLLYAIAQWLLLSIVYILAGLTIYHACTQSEMSYMTMCKRFPLWVRVCIPVCIVLGVILIILENDYYIGLLEQLNQGNINLMDALNVNFVSPYYRIREVLRLLNIGILVYGCSTIYKNYDKQGE